MADRADTRLLGIILLLVLIGTWIDLGSSFAHAQEPVSQKSLGKAMLLSCLVPGLGQIYIGEKRGVATGIAMVSTDALALWRYAYNRSEGDRWKKDYQSWAKVHYRSARFWKYVRDTVVVYSGYQDFGRCKDPSIYDSTECWRAIEKIFYLGVEGSDTYYDQIGRERIYIFGWDDWNPYSVPNHEDLWTDWQPGDAFPSLLPQTTDHRDHYNHLRRMADRNYGRANVYAWVMVIGRVVSMIDAAVMLKMRSFEIGSIEVSPRLSLARRTGQHGFDLSIGVRF